MKRRVSTIIPAYNAEPFLRDAIESVLCQGQDIELIVVNDGSTDETGAIIDSYGSCLTHISQQRKGLGGARNRGIASSGGNWIAFLDADDIWLPAKIKLQLDFLHSKPDLDMVFGHAVEFSDPANSWPARTELFPAYFAGTMLTRRILLDKVGPFDETGRLGEFLDWYSRAGQAGACAWMIEELVLRRRVHATNMTRGNADKRGEYLEVIRAHMQRRRSEP